MSNNNLPPELVEKMQEAWNKPNSIQSCAQIAVEYQTEQLALSISRNIALM